MQESTSSDALNDFIFIFFTCLGNSEYLFKNIDMNSKIKYNPHIYVNKIWNFKLNLRKGGSVLKGNAIILIFEKNCTR